MISLFRARADWRSRPNGFSIMTRRQDPIILPGKPGRSELFDDFAEKLRSGREIEDAREYRCVIATAD